MSSITRYKTKCYRVQDCLPYNIPEGSVTPDTRRTFHFTLQWQLLHTPILNSWCIRFRTDWERTWGYMSVSSSVLGLYLRIRQDLYGRRDPSSESISMNWEEYNLKYLGLIGERLSHKGYWRSDSEMKEGNLNRIQIHTHRSLSVWTPDLAHQTSVSASLS